jgi:hypothetical protein
MLHLARTDAGRASIVRAKRNRAIREPFAK